MAAWMALDREHGEVAMMSDRMWDLVYWVGGGILVWWVICAVLALIVFGFLFVTFVRQWRSIGRHQDEMQRRMDRWR